MAKKPTNSAATHRGGRALAATTAPSPIADSAMAPSVYGSGTPMSPSIPPNAITIGKVTGRAQIAGVPSCAPHSPTDTIATMWSSPEIGCSNPLMKPPTASPSRRMRPSTSIVWSPPLTAVDRTFLTQIRIACNWNPARAWSGRHRLEKV